MHDFNSLKFVKISFLTQNTVYIGEYFMWLERSIYSGVIEWNDLFISIRASWLMLFNSSIYLMIICVLILLIIEKGILKTLGRTGSRVMPNNPCLLVSPFLYNPRPLIVSGVPDFLLINRIWQRLLMLLLQFYYII